MNNLNYLEEIKQKKNKNKIYDNIPQLKVIQQLTRIEGINTAEHVGCIYSAVDNNIYEDYVTLIQVTYTRYYYALDVANNGDYITLGADYDTKMKWENNKLVCTEEPYNNRKIISVCKVLFFHLTKNPDEGGLATMIFKSSTYKTGMDIVKSPYLFFRCSTEKKKKGVSEWYVPLFQNIDKNEALGNLNEKQLQKIDEKIKPIREFLEKIEENKQIER